MTSKPTVRVDHLSFRDSGQFSPRDVAYAEHDERLLAFAQAPPTLEAFAGAIEQRRAVDTDRELLVEVTREQYKAYGVKPPKHLRRLTEPDAFTVVTAHQASLFLGPLYYVYKILSAVKLAAQLNEAYPDTYIVPVFVLGAEDHDLDEIDHLTIEGRRITWDTEQTGSTGQMTLTGIEAAVDEVAEALGDSLSAKQAVETLRKTYRPDRTLGEATAAYVAQLFQAYGVVVVNLADARYKRAFAPMIEREVIGRVSRPLVEATQAELEAAGFGAQAFAREINFFYLQPGRRDRIERDLEGYRVVDTDVHFTEEAMRAEIAEHPERFSPNVVMRPLLQELCLPNLAYVGGGGELAYWLERRSQFEAFGLPFPILVRRDSAWWIEQRLALRLQRYGIAPSELLGDTDALLRTYVKTHHDVDLDFAPAVEQIEAVFADVSARAASVDATLERRPLATAAHARKRLRALETRLVRELKKQKEREVSAIREVARALVPGGGLQERTESFLPFYVRYGARFFDALLEAFDPLRMELKVFTEAPPAVGDAP